MTDHLSKPITMPTWLLALLVVIVGGATVLGSAVDVFRPGVPEAGATALHEHESLPGHPILVERVGSMVLEQRAQGIQLDDVAARQIRICAAIEGCEP